jgi:hypothetical protein
VTLTWSSGLPPRTETKVTVVGPDAGGALVGVAVGAGLETVGGAGLPPPPETGVVDDGGADTGWLLP